MGRQDWVNSQAHLIFLIYIFLCLLFWNIQHFPLNLSDSCQFQRSDGYRSLIMNTILFPLRWSLRGGLPFPNRHSCCYQMDKKERDSMAFFKFFFYKGWTSANMSPLWEHESKWHGAPLTTYHQLSLKRTGNSSVLSIYNSGSFPFIGKSRKWACKQT